LHITKVAGLRDTETRGRVGGLGTRRSACRQAAFRPAQDADHRRDPGRQVVARHPVADGPRTGGADELGGQHCGACV
jgi:hypothetical protein